MHSHQRLTQPDSSPGWVTSSPPQRIQASPQTEPTSESAERNLKAERERAERLGHHFSRVKVLSDRPPTDPIQQLQLSIQRQQDPTRPLTDASQAATDFYAQQVLAGEKRGGLAGWGQQALGYAGGYFSSLSTQENLPKTALTLAGGATVGALLPGVTSAAGLGTGTAAGAGIGGATSGAGTALKGSSMLFSGGQAALTQQLPNWVIPATATAGVGAAWMSSPWGPMQEGMMPYINTGYPAELGDPSEVREDLIPMTGDLPAQVEGIPIEPPMSQVLGEDPVQVPGAHEPETIPLEPRSAQVETFPDAELNQPGEAAPASSKEQGALERAMQAANWEQVKDYIGKPVSAGLPPGYIPRNKGGGELVRQIRDDSQQVPLHVDESGLIQIRVGSSSRISTPYRMKKNFTQAYGEIEEGFWSHHLLPDEVVQRTRLTQFAHEKGWYDLDRGSNQLGMPDKETFEDIRSGERAPVNKPGHTSTVGHWSNHDKYSREVEADLNASFDIIAEYFGVTSLEEVSQERMRELKDMVMESITQAEEMFRERIHRGQVETKDGRMSWEQDEMAEA